jgi:hypothetical protein
MPAQREATHLADSARHLRPERLEEHRRHLAELHKEVAWIDLRPFELTDSGGTCTHLFKLDDCVKN